MEDSDVIKEFAQKQDKEVLHHMDSKLHSLENSLDNKISRLLTISQELDVKMGRNTSEMNVNIFN